MVGLLGESVVLKRKREPPELHCEVEYYVLAIHIIDSLGSSSSSREFDLQKGSGTVQSI